MTYSFTVNAGVKNLVVPSGERYQPGDALTLTDEEYGRLTAGARSLLTPGAGTTSSGYLGGTVSHQVTLAGGTKNVVLPDGLRHKAADVVVLSDAQYSTIPAAAKAALFSADTTTLT